MQRTPSGGSVRSAADAVCHLFLFGDKRALADRSVFRGAFDLRGALDSAGILNGAGIRTLETPLNRFALDRSAHLGFPERARIRACKLVAGLLQYKRSAAAACIERDRG